MGLGARSNARLLIIDDSPSEVLFLETILEEAGVPSDSVRERNVGFSLTPALLTGRVDAVLGAFWNYEGTELKMRGKRPRIIRMEEAGVPEYDELVLVANEDALERDGDKIRAFIGAVSRGTRELRDEEQQHLSDEAMRGAMKLISDHRSKLDQLASALLRNEVLERKDIDRIMEGVPRFHRSPGQGLRMVAATRSDTARH